MSWVQTLDKHPQISEEILKMSRHSIGFIFHNYFSGDIKNYYFIVRLVASYELSRESLQQFVPFQVCIQLDFVVVIVPFLVYFSSWM